VNSRLGSIRALTIVSLPKSGNSHLSEPSLHSPPLCGIYSYNSGCTATKLPEQERKEQLALPAESSKKFPNSPVLTWTLATAAQQPHVTFLP